MNTNSINQRLFKIFTLMLFACFAAYLTASSISLYGPGISPDSTRYIQLAHDISSNGLAFLTENKSVTQPPLFPLALAVTSMLTGFTYIRTAGLLNILCSSASVIVILLTASSITRSSAVLILLGLLSCFSIPLVYVWSWAWSEPLFILTISLIILLFSMPKISNWTAFLAGLLTTVAFFTRYAGIVLIPATALFLVLYCSGSAWNRCKRLVVFAFPSIAMPSLYVARNYAVSGTLLGNRSSSQLGISDNVDLVKDVVFAWFLPVPIRSFETLILLICAILGGAAWHYRHNIGHAIRHSKRVVVYCAVFCAAYTSFIVWTSSTTAYDHINNRLLSPLYPPLLIIFSSLLKPEIWRNTTVRIFALFTFFICCVLHHIWEVHMLIKYNANHGAGGYNVQSWHNSELCEYVRQIDHPIDETVFSNYPDALYIMADVLAKQSPVRQLYNSSETTGVSGANIFIKYPSLDGALLVWFVPNQRKYLFTLTELEIFCELDVVKHLADGTIYRIRCPNNTIDKEK